MYHTQERRSTKLLEPVPCVRDDAWLGEGSYYWDSLEDAEYWGNKSKRRTGFYEVYQSMIKFVDILDTVFNEEHYRFWLKQIEKAGTKFVKETGEKPTLKELNNYFKDNGVWDGINGILFQDLPENNHFLIVKPIERQVKGQTKYISFAYKKRLQLVVYNPEIISNFDLLKVNQVI